MVGRAVHKLRILTDAVTLVMALALACAYVLVWLVPRARAVRKRAKLASEVKVLVLQPNAHLALRQHGPGVILENHSIDGADEICLIDASAEEDFDAALPARMRVVAWRVPRSARALRRWGLFDAASVLEEAIIASRLVSFAAAEGFCVIKSVMHDRTALRGFIVASSLRRPHIIEVSGNYELLQRLLGFTYYFGYLYQVRWMKGLIHALSNWILGIPLRHAFRVLGRNKNNYEHAFALGAPIDRLALVRIRINEGFLALESGRALPRPLAQRYILYVARMSTEKYPGDVIDAFDIVAGAIEDVQLVMIGGGPLLGLVEARRARSPFASRIRVLGALPNAEVLPWTSGASLALEFYSGSSLVEKMLSGVPVVAYDIEWMSEVVIDGYSGYLVAFRDVEGVARCAMRALTTPEEASAMADRGRHLARAMFDRRRVLEQENRHFRAAVQLSRETSGCGA